MVDRAVGEATANGEAGMAGPDDDSRRGANGAAPLLSVSGARFVDEDGDVGGVGDDIVYRRALLRLRDQRLDRLGRRVGVDLVANRDAVEAVADIAVDAEDALDVHAALDRRLHRAKLN